MGKCVAIKIAVLQALSLAPSDTLHALAAFLGFSAVAFRLLLAGADTAGLEAATFEWVGYDCLPGASAFAAMDQSIGWVKVFVLMNLNQIVSPSFTL